MSSARFPSMAAGLSLVALAWATQASAHAVLVRSSPEANATVAAPKAISLTFNERLAPAFSGFALAGRGGAAMKVRITLSSDRKTMIGVPAAPLRAGAYKLSWRAAASDDGHLTKGELAFRVK